MDCIKDLQDAIRNILVNNGLTELCLESLTNWTIPPISSGMTGTVSLTKTRY